MATFNKEELEELLYFAMGSSEIEQLIQEKKETLDKLNNNKNSSFQTPTPTPKPKGDIKLTPEKELHKDLKDAQSKIIENTRSNYDNKIDKAARKNINDFGYEHHKKKVDKLSKDEVVLLVEKGADAVLDKQKQQEIAKEEKEQKEFDQELNSEPEINSPESKELNLNKEPAQEIDIAQTMKLSNEQRDAIIENGSYIDLDDDSKNKDIDKSKQEKEPSDFQKNSKDITTDNFE